MTGRDARAVPEPRMAGVGNRVDRISFPDGVAQTRAWAGAGDLIDVLHLIRVHPDATLAALLRLGWLQIPARFGSCRRRCAPPRCGPAPGRPSQLPSWRFPSSGWRSLSTRWSTRPRAIAANLAWTVRRQLRPFGRAPCGSRSFGTAPPHPHRTTPTQRTHVAEARRWGSERRPHPPTLSCVYGEDAAERKPPTALPTPELIRWRCSRALRRLRPRGSAQRLNTEPTPIGATPSRRPPSASSSRASPSDGAPRGSSEVFRGAGHEAAGAAGTIESCTKGRRRGARRALVCVINGLPWGRSGCSRRVRRRSSAAARGRCACSRSTW